MAAKLFPMLSCSDLDRSLTLYEEVLGGVETYRFPDEGKPVFLTLSMGGGSEIGLGGVGGQPAHGRPRRPASGHRIELCVYVDDVDATYARVRAAGFEVVLAPCDSAWGEQTAWVADPDGNLIMLTR